MQTAEPIINIVTINDPSALSTSPAEAAARSQKPVTREPQAMSLSDIRARLGVVLVPSHLPHGFDLRASVFYGTACSIRYEGPALPTPSPSGYKGRPVIEVGQFRGITRRVMSGSLAPITVGGRDGYLIHGAWLFHGARGVFEWKEEIVTTVALRHSGFAMAVTGMPAREFTDAVLLEIAESIGPY